MARDCRLCFAVMVAPCFGDDEYGNDINFDIETTEYDPRMWLVTGQCYEVKIRFFHDGPYTDCNHKECENIRSPICRHVYVCSCVEYCNESTFCPHLARLGEPSMELRRMYDGRLKDMHLEILMNGGAARNHDDKFDYFRYFSDRNNFDLNLNEVSRKSYWKGYEDVLARHHYGVDLILRRYGEVMKSSDCYKFTEIEGDRCVKYFTTICSRKEACKCSAFELCTTCRKCKHQVFCTCEDYSSGFFCRHCHASVMMKHKRRTRPYQFRKLSYYYRDQFRRFFFLNMFLRVRHNVGINLKTIYYEGSSFVLVEDKDENGYGVVYEVKCAESGCERLCTCGPSLTCTLCEICRHDFMCVCSDFTAGFLCTHVHAAYTASREIKTDYFDEEFRPIDVRSEIDENEASYEEEIHPTSTWNNTSRVELEYLAYKPLIFDHISKRSPSVYVVMTCDGFVRMVGNHYTPEEGDEFVNYTEKQGIEMIFGEYYQHFYKYGVFLKCRLTSNEEENDTKKRSYESESESSVISTQQRDSEGALKKIHEKIDMTRTEQWNDDDNVAGPSHRYWSFDYSSVGQNYDSDSDSD